MKDNINEMIIDDLKKTNAHLEIISVYDNKIFDQTHTQIDSWGLSCVIKTDDETVLFDTGRHIEVLLINMGRMGIDPKNIDIVVISHDDDDHCGALPGFLNINPEVRVYLPASFDKKILEKIEHLGPQIHFVDSARKITAGVYSTGEMISNRTGEPHYKNGIPKKEQSLVLVFPSGILSLTGCAHASLEDIILKTIKMSGEYPRMICGGFHCMNYSETELIDELSNIYLKRIEYIAPTHCAGTRIAELLKTGKYNKYIDFGLGRRFFTSELI